MSAPSSSSCEVVDLSLAAICDDATSRPFFSGGGGDGDFSWPPAARIQSSLKKQEWLVALCDRHGVPREFKPVSAGILGCAACEAPPQGSNALCIYADALEEGLRFPLHHFYIKLLRHYGLAPSQLVPNSWKYMAAFVLRCKDAGVEPLVSVFRYFFSLCAHKLLGWHYFIPCPGRPCLFSGPLRTRQGWRSRYFFLQSPEGMPWKCLVAWGKPRMEDARIVQLTDAAIEKLKQMPCIDFKDLFSLHAPPVGDLTVLQMHSTPVPMVKPESAAASAQAVALTSLHQLHGTLEAGARAASAADPASEGDDLMWRTRAKRRCRGLGPASVTVTPPVPQSFAISAVPPPQGMEMTPCETSFDGALGSSEISMPSGICASDALYMYDAMMAIDAEKARLQDEQQATDAKAAQVIAHLQDQLQQVSAANAKFLDYLVAARAEKAQLKEKYTSEISMLNQEHASEVAKLHEEHHKASTAHAEKVKAEHIAEFAKLQEKHAAEVAKLNQEHASEVSKLQEEHHKANTAVARKVQAEHTTEIAKLQEKHAAEIAKLNQAHDAVVTWLMEEHEDEVARVKHAAEVEAVQDAKKEIALALFPDLDASLL